MIQHSTVLYSYCIPFRLSDRHLIHSTVLYCTVPYYDTVKRREDTIRYDRRGVFCVTLSKTAKYAYSIVQAESRSFDRHICNGRDAGNDTLYYTILCSTVQYSD